MTTHRLLAFLMLLALTVPCLAQDEDAVDEWFDRAERYAARGSWARAAKYYARVHDAEPDDAEVSTKLDMALAGCGHYEERGALTEKMVAADPGDIEWVLRRAEHLVVGRLARRTRGTGTQQQHEQQSGQRPDDHVAPVAIGRCGSLIQSDQEPA